MPATVVKVLLMPYLPKRLRKTAILFFFLLQVTILLLGHMGYRDLILNIED